jgi:hypothetical protein
MYKVGMTIRILQMEGEPQYDGRVGVIEHVDAIGQLHGTWGGLAVQPERDSLQIVPETLQERTNP